MCAYFSGMVDSTAVVVLAALCCVAVMLVAAIVVVLVVNRGRKTSEPPPPPTPPDVNGSPGEGDGGGEWSTANATYYLSYPPCCKGSPNYDPKADTTECDVYSGCKYQGMFAALNDKKSYNWVRDNNIAAVFETGQTAGSWASKWKNKKLRVRNPSNGKTLDVTVLDRCDDGDCDGCCTKNANKGGGMLIDLEYHTAKRLWGGEPKGEQKIQWRRA